VWPFSHFTSHPIFESSAKFESHWQNSQELGKLNQLAATSETLTRKSRKVPLPSLVRLTPDQRLVLWTDLNRLPAVRGSFCIPIVKDPNLTLEADTKQGICTWIDPNLQLPTISRASDYCRSTWRPAKQRLGRHPVSPRQVLHSTSAAADCISLAHQAHQTSNRIPRPSTVASYPDPAFSTSSPGDADRGREP
jgi:hypothetical protein